MVTAVLAPPSPPGQPELWLNTVLAFLDQMMDLDHTYALRKDRHPLMLALAVEELSYIADCCILLLPLFHEAERTLILTALSGIDETNTVSDGHSPDATRVLTAYLGNIHAVLENTFRRHPNLLSVDNGNPENEAH